MKKSFIISSLFIFALSSCKKNLLDTTPYSQLSTESMWTSDNLTDLGVNGIYSALRLGIQTGGESNLEIYQYDRLGLTGQYRNSDGLMAGTETPSNGIFASNWQNLYEGIIRANDAIKNIPLKSPSDDTKKARLVAEAKFLRAYFYFRLNQLYKGVPIYLEPTKYDAFTKPRSSEQDVWNQVIHDLTDCINEPAFPN